MFKRRKKFQHKSKDVIKEASDIIANTEQDKDAIHFLRETLVDDYPEMDLTKMDLQEATELLPDTNKRKRTKPSDIMEELNNFLSGNSNNSSEKKKKPKTKKRRR